MFIYGIDPGSNLGLAIYNVDSYFNVSEIITSTFELNKHASNMEDKTLLLDKWITREFEIRPPFSLVMEDAFINRFMPGAVLPLAYIRQTVTLAVKRFDKEVYVTSYSPKYVKTRIGVDMRATDNKKIDSKTLVTTAISRIEDIKNKYSNLNIKSEHEIDAMAIAYTYILDAKTYLN